MKKNPYKQDKRYLPNPFNYLYNLELDTDEPLIHELIEQAQGIEDSNPTMDISTFHIKNEIYGFVRAGLQAFKAKLTRSYKDCYGTYKDYCKFELFKSAWQINRYIIAAGVVLELISLGFYYILPTNVSQCLVLADLHGEELREAWQKVIDNINPSEITTGSILQLLYPDLENEVKPWVKFPIKLYLELSDLASDLDLSIVQLIDSLIDHYSRTKKKCANALTKKWLTDLDDLATNYKLC